MQNHTRSYLFIQKAVQLTLGVAFLVAAFVGPHIVVGVML